ncbi:helix-turn-helix domain-containing protein [Alicycliphilus denitrificans]|uniref:helix-turn-helix domain-containing protein n=1 Tax=Alicycliphilus denitrificans TaxID=179636 RepID=UPI000C9F5E94|nr:helix-turn-helix transcriptional regulator [Alicycliphilus denitrificans]
MHNLKSIRERLAVTQQALAQGLGCTQSNVANYERGQTLPPDMARKVIDFAATFGVSLSFDHIYGSLPLPSFPTQEPAQAWEASKRVPDGVHG